MPTQHPPSQGGADERRPHTTRLPGGAGAGVAGTALGAFGFGGVEAAYAAAVKPFRLTGTVEARSTCPYCAVSCGMMVFSAESQTEPGKMEVVHIEGDVDNPVNRGTLCPKGAAAIDYVRSPMRVKAPMYRKPGANGFEEVTWDFAMDRIARLMKEDRDANFIEANNDGVHGEPMADHGLPLGQLLHQRDRLGDLEGRARSRDAADRKPSEDLTRTDGVQSGPNIRSRCNDEQLDGHR